MTTTKRRFHKWKLSRDSVLFISGLAGIAYETIANHGDRPTLLILFGGMVGLPALLRQDEHMTSKKAKPSEDEEEAEE